MSNQNLVPSTPTASSSDNSMSYLSGSESIVLTPAIVRQYLIKGDAKNVTNSEIINFMYLCKFNELNPFLGEAYLIKFGSNPQMVISKEAFLKRAERNANYLGIEAGLLVLRDKLVVELEGTFYLPTDTIVGGWCRVFRSDRNEKGFYNAVAMAEYDKKESIWKGKPATMIRKVAIVQALRECFPQNLGALYVAEEFEDAHLVDATNKRADDVVEQQKALSAQSDNVHNISDNPFKPAKEEPIPILANDPDERKEASGPKLGF